MRRIDNLVDLDKQLAEVEAAFAISDNDGRRVMNGFEYVLNHSLPDDPTSPEYFEAQMKIYQEISDRENYDALKDEETAFDFEALKDAPFPYSTSSPSTVGDQLIAQGFLIRAMNLPAGSHILEFGPGWGNTTLHLVQMGYHLTAVDVEQNFLDLIAYRVGLINKTVETIRQDMLVFDTDKQYDAILFFECFHHCKDHITLLNRLHKFLKDDGMIVFGAEPIVPWWPVPWGVRLDGISVWSIRKHGWLELGFNMSYFLRLLLQLGWTPQYHTSPFGVITNVITARKSHLTYFIAQTVLPPDEDQTWSVPETDPSMNLRFALKKSIMSVSKRITPKAVEFCLTNYAPHHLHVTLSTGDFFEEVVVPAGTSSKVYTIPVQQWHGKVIIDSETWETQKPFWVRHCPKKFMPFLPDQMLKNIDWRVLGIAVHSIRLIE